VTTTPPVIPDVLDWLGFEHGDPDEPLLPWHRPRRWPSSERFRHGRHRARGRAA